MREVRNCACVIAGVVAAASVAHGAVVTQYTFASDLSATTVGTNITSASNFGGLTDGSVAPGRSSTSGFAIEPNGSNYTGGNPLNNVTSTGSSVGSVFGRRFLTGGAGDGFQHYFGFSLTVADGYALNIDSVVFDLGLRGLSANAIKVEYSTTSGFTSGVVKIGEGTGYIGSPQTGLGYGTGGTLGVVQSGSGSSNPFSWNRFTNTTNLGGNEQLEDTIYFRIWAKGGTGTATQGQSNVYIDNITVNGTTSLVPEPAALGVVGLAGLGVLRRRR